MIALPPVDPAEFIMESGNEMQKCINKYFNEIPLEEAARPEILDPKYSPELLGTLRDEYYAALERIWNSIPTYRHTSFEGLYETPELAVAGDLDALQKAYDAAVRRTLWERLSKNDKDVFKYKNLLKLYCEALLWNMHARFIDITADINR
jgi:hypothetical protein